MIFKHLARKIVGTKNERELKRIQPLVERTNQLEAATKQLSDTELAAKSAQFRERVAHGESLDALLPEAFAVVREASRRTLGMRHFDCQLVGGVVLHEGTIAEMKTGEGKTLMATLPLYLNAMSGKGAHVITVNDYLARRDAEWMGPIYKFLGLSVGVIVHDMSDTERAWAYRADCTYGTNNEFGFDYLRDNMKFRLEEYVQRDLNFAIVDEVDSILIDEARTPLIISGPAEASTKLYTEVNQLMPFLKKEKHFTVDEKAKSAILTDDGVKECERRLKVENLFEPRNISLVHHVNQALRAHALYQRDVDYVVKDGKITIVDEFTGRLMSGRRWSDGLHQAVEAKEGVRVENENQTLATITFQNFFRMYSKLAGMTGTADTESAEFAKIYDLEVLVIPTNEPMIREDRDDLIYKTEAAKFHAIVDEIKDAHEKGQPVLVGTISIEKSEQLAHQLTRSGVRHNVLNAKQHDREAEIVSQAGRKGSVTISTNMAGRGTDIKLGGNPEMMARVKAGDEATEEEYQATFKTFEAQCAAEREEVLAAGGLYIVGTERHESRRIDNQLRGRSGRQGDPGASCFFLSLEDSLLRVFGGERIKGMMDKMGMEEDEVIQHRWLNRAIENSQRRVEEHNFSIRKNLLEYDDVMNQQRRQVYARRREILSNVSLKDLVLNVIDEMVGYVIDTTLPDKLVPGEVDVQPFQDAVVQHFNLKFDLAGMLRETMPRDELGARLYGMVEQMYLRKIERYTADVFGQVEKYILLTTLDALWKEHLLQMDHLKEGIHLRGYAQKDPLVEYKKEGFALFQMAMHYFAKDVVEKIVRVEVQTPEAAHVDAADEALMPPMEMLHGEMRAFAGGARQQGQMAAAGGGGALLASGPPASRASSTAMRKGPKVGRNDPCHCGSGKKYKKCHGV